MYIDCTKCKQEENKDKWRSSAVSSVFLADAILFGPFSYGSKIHINPRPRTTTAFESSSWSHGWTVITFWTFIEFILSLVFAIFTFKTSSELLEVLSSDKVDDELCPAGYKLIDYPRTGRGGGGIRLLYKDSLRVTKVRNGEEESFEYCELLVQISSSRKTRVVIVYRPPFSKNHRLPMGTFLRQFSSYMKSIILSNDHLLILGDQYPYGCLNRCWYSEFCGSSGITRPWAACEWADPHSRPHPRPCYYTEDGEYHSLSTTHLSLFLWSCCCSLRYQHQQVCVPSKENIVQEGEGGWHGLF